MNFQYSIQAIGHSNAAPMRYGISHIKFDAKL